MWDGLNVKWSTTVAVISNRASVVTAGAVGAAENEEQFEACRVTLKVGSELMIPSDRCRYRVRSNVPLVSHRPLQEVAIYYTYGRRGE